MGETLPLATIHDAVLEFLRGRDDAVLYGAQAVNAYVNEPRMTQDVDVMSTRGAELAEELRAFLNKRFFIAARVREIRDGLGYRVYQVQKPANRHLIDVRPVTVFPPTQRVAEVLVITPPELIAEKVVSYHERRNQPKAGTDWRDLAMLLLTFPGLKAVTGPVSERLELLIAGGADAKSRDLWATLVAQEIKPSDEDSEFE